MSAKVVLMVWGMRLPDRFGEFWPDGDFEYDPKTQEGDWPDRLRRHYLTQSPDEQIRLFDYRGFDHGGNGVGFGAAGYRSSIWGKFISEVGTKDGPDALPFTPVEAHEAPASFNTEKSYPVLGSLIKLNGFIMAVDEAMKALIAGLDPGVHQFFPIDIVMPNGQRFERTFHTLVIRRYLDSYSPEESDESKKNMTGRAFRKEVFGSCHLWRDRRFPLVNCLSDELAAKITEAGLRVPKHYRMREV